MATTRQTVKTEISEPDNNPGVIAYRVGQLERTVVQGFKEHNEKLDALVNNFTPISDHNALVSRVVSLESDRKWIVRLVIGAVVFTMLALIGVGFKLNK